MAKHKALIAVALAGFMVSGVAAAADQGQCWSSKDFTVKAGDNACKSASNSCKTNHACKGQAKADNSDGKEFKMATKAECDAWKGTFKAAK